MYRWPCGDFEDSEDVFEFQKSREGECECVRGERLKKKKSSVTVAEFGTAGVANVVLTRQQRSGDCVGDLFAVCKIRWCF